MDTAQLNTYFPYEQQSPIVEQLSQRVGLTRTRAEYFVRLWVYLLVKQQANQPEKTVRPLQQLSLLSKAVSCSHSEAARLFYGDKEKGSDRAAGMMLDKFAALGLIKKQFDGNVTRIEIQLSPEVLQTATDTPVTLALDDFNPRCDAVPVANLLAINYGWMNRSLEIVPHRITRLLRRWASQYATGMRVLRRSQPGWLLSAVSYRCRV